MIHNIASEGNCEQVVAWVLNLLFQHKNVEGVPEFVELKVRYLLSLLSVVFPLAKKEFMVDGFLAVMSQPMGTTTRKSRWSRTTCSASDRRFSTCSRTRCDTIGSQVPVQRLNHLGSPPSRRETLTISSIFLLSRIDQRVSSKNGGTSTGKCGEQVYSRFKSGGRIARCAPTVFFVQCPLSLLQVSFTVHNDPL